ncbi:MAG: hypothetical protein KBD37_04640 [Burkholderiales bacterium]|nr:hypothetical protein [Burkholderiales bacterium]
MIHNKNSYPFWILLSKSSFHARIKADELAPYFSLYCALVQLDYPVDAIDRWEKMVTVGFLFGLGCET